MSALKSTLGNSSGMGMEILCHKLLPDHNSWCRSNVSTFQTACIQLTPNQHTAIIDTKTETVLIWEDKRSPPMSSSLELLMWQMELVAWTLQSDGLGALPQVTDLSFAVFHWWKRKIELLLHMQDDELQACGEYGGHSSQHWSVCYCTPVFWIQYLLITTAANNHAHWIHSSRVFLKYREKKIQRVVAISHGLVQTQVNYGLLRFLKGVLDNAQFGSISSKRDSFVHNDPTILILLALILNRRLLSDVLKRLPNSVYPAQFFLVVGNLFFFSF